MYVSVCACMRARARARPCVPSFARNWQLVGVCECASTHNATDPTHLTPALPPTCGEPHRPCRAQARSAHYCDAKCTRTHHSHTCQPCSGWTWRRCQLTCFMFETSGLDQKTTVVRLHHAGDSPDPSLARSLWWATPAEQVKPSSASTAALSSHTTCECAQLRYLGNKQRSCILAH